MRHFAALRDYPLFFSFNSDNRSEKSFYFSSNGLAGKGIGKRWFIFTIPSGEESHYTGYFDVVAIMNLLSFS
jgi:hypothetical protein